MLFGSAFNPENRGPSPISASGGLIMRLIRGKFIREKTCAVMDQTRGLSGLVSQVVIVHRWTFNMAATSFWRRPSFCDGVECGMFGLLAVRMIRVNCDKILASMFRLKDRDCLRFMDFLRGNDCLLDFRLYRQSAANVRKS
jgi:hypothetical protein